MGKLEANQLKVHDKCYLIHSVALLFTHIHLCRQTLTYEMKPHFQSITAGKPALRTNSTALFYSMQVYGSREITQCL